MNPWYPSELFVGDTFCYFSGMTLAVVGKESLDTLEGTRMALEAGERDARLFQHAKTISKSSALALDTDEYSLMKQWAITNVVNPVFDATQDFDMPDLL